MDDKTYSIYFENLAYFQGKMEHNPEYAMYMPIAYIYQKLEQHSDAIEMCERGLAKFPEYRPLQVVLALSLIEAGRKDEAREFLIEVVMEDSYNYKALKTLGWLYKGESKGADAIKYLKAAYLLAPEDTEIISWLDELGVSAQHIRDAVNVEQPAFQNEEFFDMDGLNYNVDANINEAQSTISNLMDQISGVAEEPKEQPLDASVQESYEYIELEEEETMEDGVAATQKPDTPDEPYTSEKEETTEDDFDVALKQFGELDKSTEDDFDAALKQFNELAKSSESVPTATTAIDAPKEAAPFIPEGFAASVYEESGLDPDNLFGDEPVIAIEEENEPEEKP